MKYTEEFIEAAAYSNKNNLFLGYGNPNGKVLMIGKEEYYQSKETPDTESFYNEILSQREKINSENNNSWSSNIDDQFQPEWNNNLDRVFLNSNALTKYWGQKNILNRQLKNGDWNMGTSSTYKNYQKIYQNAFLGGKKEDYINFQKEFFITELNDLIAEKDFKFNRLAELKSGFINQRAELLSLPFFKTFPVVVIASGHYSKEFQFDIEKTFKVNYVGEPVFIGKSWYNIHYSENKDRIVLHTRQLSTSVTNELIDALSNEIKAQTSSQSK